MHVCLTIKTQILLFCSANVLLCNLCTWLQNARLNNWSELRLRSSDTVPQKHLQRMGDTSVPSASSQLHWHEPAGVALQLTKIPAHLHPAGVRFFITDLGSLLTWECRILRAISIPLLQFTSAAFKQDICSSKLLSPDWKSRKVLLTWEVAGEGIWRREMNFHMGKFCMTSRQKTAREIHGWKRDTINQQSWKKSRNGGKSLARVGKVVSLGISDCDWISTLINAFAGETETETSTVT